MSGRDTPVPVAIAAEGSGHVSVNEDGGLTLAPEARILIVDPDGVTRRFVELALGRVRGAHVTTAVGVADALVILSEMAIDLVIAAGRLRDGDGLELRRRMTREPRLSRVPFVMLSAEPRASAKVAALLGGVDDYLVKPCDAAELGARAATLINRSRRARCAARTRQTTLSGDFDTLPLADLVAALELGGQSGRLSVSTPRAMAEVLIAAGRVIHARYGAQVGVEAFALLLDEGRGTFELTRVPVPTDAATIAMSTTALLMESARLADEWRAGAGRSEPVPADGSAGADGPAAGAGDASVALVGPKPPPELARVFEHGLTDGWTPGELAVLAREDLSAWTRAGGRERFHVHLVTELGLGLQAFVELSAPPGAATLLAALRGDPCAVVLSHRVRGDRLLDVVLLDLANPAALRADLGRSPSLIVVAPPDGDPHAMTAHCRVGLAGLVGTLAPSVVLGVGGTALEEYLGAFRSEANQTAVRCLPGALGVAGEGDELSLRRILVEGVRLFGVTGGGARYTWV